MKTQFFFLDKLYHKFFCPTLSLHRWYSIPILVWFEQLFDSMEKNYFLKFARIRNSRDSQNSVWKPHFFSSTSYYKNSFCFTHSLQMWYSIPSWVWFEQLLDPMKKTFYRIPFSRNSKVAYEKLTFFLDKLYQNSFCFTLSLHWWYSLPIGFDFDNSLTQWKITIFEIRKNSQFARFAKFRMKTQFFPRQAIPKNILLYTFITPVSFNSEFGLIWTTPLPDEKEFFKNSPEFAIREIRKNPYVKPFFS